MVRDQDDVAITFSLWEQARRELAAAENRLYEKRKLIVDARELDILDAEIAVRRVHVDRLLGQAIEALREHSARLGKGRPPPGNQG